MQSRSLSRAWILAAIGIVAAACGGTSIGEIPPAEDTNTEDHAPVVAPQAEPTAPAPTTPPTTTTPPPAPSAPPHAVDAGKVQASDAGSTDPPWPFPFDASFFFPDASSLRDSGHSGPGNGKDSGGGIRVFDDGGISLFDGAIQLP